jgi:hypothetical protein
MDPGHQPDDQCDRADEQRESVGYFTFAGTTVVSARTWPVLATLASLALLSSTH